MSEREREKRKVHKTNLLEISFMIFFSTCLFAYIYAHYLHIGVSPLHFKQASERAIRERQRGILYFHIYWSNCISCFKALETLYHACEEEREREHTENAAACRLYKCYANAM